MRNALIAIVILISVILLYPQPTFAADNIVQVAEDVIIDENSTFDEVTVIYGNCDISGRVNDSVVVVGGNLTLGPRSRVEKDVTVVMGKIDRIDGSYVGGDITRIAIPKFLPLAKGFVSHGWLALLAIVGIAALIGVIAVAMLIAALMPGHIDSIVTRLENSFFLMAFMGIVWSIMSVVISGLLIVSIIGILLIPIVVIIVVISYIIGYVASSEFIGKNVAASFKKAVHPIVGLIIGVLVLFLIGLVPVVGNFIQLVFILAGFGACVTTRFGLTK